MATKRQLVAERQELKQRIASLERRLADKDATDPPTGHKTRQHTSAKAQQSLGGSREVPHASSPLFDDVVDGVVEVPDAKHTVRINKPSVFTGSNFEAFILQVSNYLRFSRVHDDAIKIAVLVSYLGSASVTYRAWHIQNDHGTYDELVNHLRSVFSTQSDTLAAKVQFRNRNRRHVETFEQFLVALQELGLIAYSSEASQLDSAVREQFILGLNYPRVQEKLMCEEFCDTISLLNRAQRLRDALNILKPNHSVSQVQHEHAGSRNQVPSERKVHSQHVKSQSGHGNNYRPHNSYSQVKCFNCQELGHYRNRCPKTSTSQASSHQKNPNQGNYHTATRK